MNTISLIRDGKKVYPLAWLSTDEAQAGIEARALIDLWRPLIQRTDTLLCTGTVDFGPHYVFKLPECNYQGEARWLTHCMIDATTVDGVQTKPSSTPGICLGKYAKFTGFYFGGDCWNRDEDGSLIGWGAADTFDAEVSFVDCELDASQNHDWCCYNWTNAVRKVTMAGGKVKFCRIGFAMAASGAKANQQITLDGVKLIGDANGSTSYGESSGPDVDKGGVLTAVLNRGGTTIMRDCTAEATGLTKPYNGKWGCPRIVALATNQYYSSSGPTSFTIERCTTKITPGTAQAWYDVDVRGAGKLAVTYNSEKVAAAEAAGDKLVAEARGGSGPDGSFKVWTPN